MEEQPWLALVIIVVGMVFSILVTYSIWNVEFFYTDYNSTWGNVSAQIYTTTEYGNPYSYVFFLIFWIYFALFIKTGFNIWRDVLEEQEGEMDYTNRIRHE